MNRKAVNSVVMGRRLVADVASGAAAGVAAALVTSVFQGVWTRLRLPPTPSPADGPPTEALAADIFREVAGAELTRAGKIVAGEAVHYAMGATLGVAYILALKRWPAVAAGHGAAYGLGVWATVEEGGLALLKLKPPPWQVEPGEHAFAASSHLVFGLVLARCLAPRHNREADANDAPAQTVDTRARSCNPAS